MRNSMLSVAVKFGSGTILGHQLHRMVTALRRSGAPGGGNPSSGRVSGVFSHKNTRDEVK